jgi:predicted solute-binding protein
LRRRYRTSPHIIPSGAPAAPVDGEVIIGDAALGHVPGGGETLIDIGREWLLLTGLPVVFAVVVGRNPAAARAVDALLAPMVARNLTHLDTMLAALHLVRHRDYFYRIQYRLEAGHQDALRTFAAMLEEEGL